MPDMSWSRKPKCPPLDLDEVKRFVSYCPVTGRWTRTALARKGKNGPAADYPVGKLGYLEVRALSKRFLAHRLAWLYMTGNWPPPDMVIDHRNGDPGDNRWENLRLATHKQNIRNQKKQTRNKTGFKGVCLNKRTNRYKAQIRIDTENGVKVLSLGDNFTTPELAAAAYVKAALIHHGEFARTS